MDSKGELMFTSAAVLGLLLQIDELKDYTIGVSESLDGGLQIQIGDSVYLIKDNNSTEISVDDSVIDEIESTTEDAYNEISEEIGEESDMPFYTDADEVVEGGILKEIAKSLALGGLIRFATKRLMK